MEKRIFYKQITNVVWQMKIFAVHYSNLSKESP
jgi:hypothetical protein